MYLQQAIDFTHSENNRESESFLEANADHFSKQAQDVLNHLLKGLSITGDEAYALYGIRHLPRRICDIRARGYNVQDERMENRCKKYFMEPNYLTELKNGIYERKNN